MEFVQQKLAQLKATWNQTSGSGRLVLMLAALLVVALMVIVSHGTGAAELTPLPTHFGADEVVRASSSLTAKGITNEIRGDQIYVAGDRSAALQTLASSDALSAEHPIDFSYLVKESSPWSTGEEQQRKWRYALKVELEKLIKAMPGVKDASVNINPGSEATLHRTPQGVTASIAVYTKRNSPLQKQTAIAMADIVAGAVNGLTRDKVNVIDATIGKPFNLKDEDGSSEFLPLMGQYENYFDARIRDHFKYITNLAVAVHCVPNMDKKSETVYDVDPTRKIEGPTTERKETVTGSGSNAGPVGVTPNTGTANFLPTSAAAGGSDKSDEHNGSPIDWKRTETVTQHALGDIKEMTVSINVPYSYFKGIEQMRADDPKAKLDEAKVQATIKTEIDKITEHAKTMIAAKDDTSVKVGWYYDVKAETPPDETGSTTKESLMVALTSYGPSAGLGLLAVLALLLVYSVVRKFQPVAPPPEALPASEGVHDAGLDLDSILEGVELEADTIRASKMQEQISNMIKEDPESVASLVKRWIAKE